MSVGKLLRDKMPETLEVLSIQLHIVVTGALENKENKKIIIK